MMEMSRGAERVTNKEEKGAVKTEVPTKVHWVKRKCENYFRFSNLILLPNFTDKILNNLALPRFILPSVPYWRYIIDLALITITWLILLHAPMCLHTLSQLMSVISSNKEWQLFALVLNFVIL